jgi:hypothetical protein
MIAPMIREGVRLQAAVKNFLPAFLSQPLAHDPLNTAWCFWPRSDGIDSAESDVFLLIFLSLSTLADQF